MSQNASSSTAPPPPPPPDRIVGLSHDTIQVCGRLATITQTSEITDAVLSTIRDLMVGISNLPDRTTAITELHTHITQLEDENRILQEQEIKNDTTIAELKTRITEMQGTINALSRAVPAQATDRHEREKIPDPEKFDGTRTKLRPFLAQLRLKAATYTDEQAKLRLAINCLKGEALDQVPPPYQRREGKPHKPRCTYHSFGPSLRQPQPNCGSRSKAP